MDFGKLLEHAKMPAAVLIGIQVISVILGLVSAGMLLLLALPLWVIGLAITAYAGFSAVKKAQVSIIEAGVVGILASVIATIVGFVISVVVTIVTTGDVVTALVGGIIGFVLSLINALIVGFVLGAIGAFVAGMMK